MAARFHSQVPSLWMAGLGVLSGVMSDLLLAAPLPGPLSSLEAPLYPGAMFGLAVATGVYLFAGASPWRALLVLVLTAIAWIAAFRGCVALYEILAVDWIGLEGASPRGGDGTIDPAEALRLKEVLKSNLLPLIASLMAGGAIGAGGAALAAATAVPRLRHPIAVLSTASIGALAAMGLFLGDTLIGSPAGYEFIALFVIWQALIAASIGYGMRPAD